MSAKKYRARKAKPGEEVLTPRHDGTLVIIGGHEDKAGAHIILKEFVKRFRGGKLIVVTAASDDPEAMFRDYQKVFRKLGVRRITHLRVDDRYGTGDEVVDKLFADASAVFFAGGDQLKLSTKLGGTRVSEQIFKLYRSGGVIGGTSAGAAIMGDTMLIRGNGEGPLKLGDSMLIPGLGLLKNIILDQHFAQRGRIGRLIGAVSVNPGLLGVGIDENTALIVEKGRIQVFGESVVYFVDGRAVSYTNVTESTFGRPVSLHGAHVHVLCEGEYFDCETRWPEVNPAP